jgi:hypothetical protein
MCRYISDVPLPHVEVDPEHFAGLVSDFCSQWVVRRQRVVRLCRVIAVGVVFDEDAVYIIPARSDAQIARAGVEADREPGMLDGGAAYGPTRLRASLENSWLTTTIKQLCLAEIIAGAKGLNIGTITLIPSHH